MRKALDSLALYGGPPVRREPFPERGHVGAEEKAAADALFDRAMATGIAPGYDGDEETAYCEELAAYLGGGYVDAVSSGTAGIYATLKALNLEPFTEVVVGPVTDPGGLMPVPLSNLIPVIADAAPNSYNTGPEEVEAVLTPLTSAIIVPYVAGEPADIEGIMEVARRRGIPVIEDCAQAHGARLHGRMLGTFGDVGVFSTMFGKHHSTGGQGGAVFTRNEAVYQAVRRASDRGKPFFLPAGSTNVIASLNLNLSDLAAGIGRVQLRKLPEIVRRRRAVVAALAEGIAGLQTVSIPTPIDGAEPSYWFLRIRFRPQTATCDKATFCRALLAEGLPVTEEYRAMPHTMEWFVRRRVFGTSGYPWASPDYAGDRDRRFPCPNAHATTESHFRLNVHEAWGDAETEDAIAILGKTERAYVATA